MGKPPPVRCACRLLAVAALILAAIARPASGQEQAEFAQAVKAAYLYKLSAFVEWPESAFASPTSPFNICVVSDSVFAHLVARAVAGQNIGRRDFVVRFLVAGDSGLGCHTLYAAGGGRLAAAALAAVRGHPVLTVTDAAASGAARGVVHFVLYSGRVRFEIDARHAREHGLAISSRVLELAVRVIQ